MRVRILQAFGRFAAGEVVALSRSEIILLDEAGQAGKVAPVDDADEGTFAFWTPTLQGALQNAQRERRRDRWH